MDIRLPKPSEAARVLQNALRRFGVELGLDQTTEVLAHVQGYRNAHVMRAEHRRKSAQLALSALSPDTFVLASGRTLNLKVDAITLRIERRGRSLAVHCAAPDAAPESTSWSTPLVRAEDQDDPWVRCEDCQWIGRESAVRPIRHFHERVRAGDICPVGECPECGALAQYCPEGPTEEELGAKVPEGEVAPSPNPRYVYGYWTHIFVGTHDTLTRLIYDRHKNRIVSLDIQSGSKWVAATPSEIADVEESLKEGNPEALLHPEEFDLAESETLPDPTEVTFLGHFSAR